MNSFSRRLDRLEERLPAPPVSADDVAQARDARLLAWMEAGRFDGYLRHRDDPVALAAYAATLNDRIVPWRTPAEMTEATRIALLESLFCRARLRELAAA